MHDGWEKEVAELKFAKRYPEALYLVRQAINEGDVAAHVMLARMGDKAGLSRTEVDQLIEYVESNMDACDAHAHWQLYLAYDQLLGNMSYEERPVRGFAHHLKAGELGMGAPISFALAHIYRFGHPAASVGVNFAEAERWYRRAIEQGSVEAAAELQEFYKEQAKNKHRGAVLEIRGKQAKTGAKPK